MKKLLIILLSVFLLTACNEENVDLNEKETEKQPVYYEFGTPTTYSSTNYQDVIELNNTRIFVKSDNGNLSICTYFNHILNCFENKNSDVEIPHLENVFGKGNCNLDSEGLHCLDGDFYCNVYFEGKVDCADMIRGHECTIFSDNSVICNYDDSVIYN